MSTHQSATTLVWFTLMVFLVSRLATAQGGPPLITDDPDTPGPGFWEINLATILDSSEAEGRHFEAPLADINYGVGRRIQLKFEIPWVTVGAHEQEVQTGIGNSTSGVKWRFLGREGLPVAWSIYPQVELNSSDSMAAKGLVEQEPEFLLPTEFTVQRGRFEINGEVGRVFSRHREDGWIAGVTTEIEFKSRGLELLGELHADKDGSEPALMIVNVGARKQLSKQITLLASGGSGVKGPSSERIHLRVYAGLQLNLPRQFDPGTPLSRKRSRASLSHTNTQDDLKERSSCLDPVRRSDIVN
jgi:hypothetical protein